MRYITARALTGLFATALAGAVAAAPIVFDGSRAAFFAATGAAQATTAYPVLSTSGPFVSGSATFTLGPGATNFELDEFTGRLAGNDLAISGIEDLNVAFAQPVIAFGFDFVEPQFDPNVNAPFEESTFAVSLYSLGLLVGSFSFSAPNDVAHFWGVQSDVLFDRVEIRETTGNNENEFFGQFFTAIRIPPNSVPEPSSSALLGAALAVMALFRRRRS